VVISPDGHRYDIDGSRSAVGIHLVGKESLRDAKVSHNHPTGKYGADSFSRYDFCGFFDLELDSIEVTYNGKRQRIEWVGERLDGGVAEELYENAIFAIAKETSDFETPVTQYSVMLYLRKTLKGLRFYEL
jgi:hypothetical protein